MITYTYRVTDVDDMNCLTPKQERAIIQRTLAAIDREILNALTGGYYVQPTWGTTFDHRPRRRLERMP